MNPELPTSQGPAATPPPPALEGPTPPGGTGPSPHRPTGALDRLIADFRRRKAGALRAEALAYAAVAFVVLFVASGFVGRPATWLGRVLLVLAPLVFAGVAGWLGLWRSRRVVGDAARTAKVLGGLVPSLGDDALSSVELRKDGQSGARFSTSLADAFVGSVDARAAGVDARTLVDSRPARRATLALLATLLLASVAVVVWWRPWANGMAYTLGAHTRPAEIVRYEPVTGDIEITYRYPAYTGLQQRTVTGTTGEISAPAGTQVLLRTRSDRPVRRAQMVVNGTELPMEVENERDLRGSFVLEKPGAYHFQFLNALGRVSVRGPEIPINVEADLAPKVEIQVPAPEIEIDPGQKVTLRYEATDDYGVTGLELVFRTPAGKEQRLPLPREDGRRTRESYTWDLGALKLAPGDRVTYHIEAKDNDAIAGAKRGVSRTQVVRIYSAAEHLREARRKVEALWERMITQLADRLESGDLEGLDGKQVQLNQRVDEAGLQLSQDMVALAAELSQMRDAPLELANALVTISESYGKVARHTRDLRRIFLRYSNRFDLGGDFGRRLQAAVQDEVAELEKDILYLESLIDRRKLEELRELARELDRERRELASLVEDYQETQDPDVREEILQQIQELRRRIDELSAKMAELAKSIRDEHLNAEALQEMMEQEDLSSQLDEIEKLMREGKTEEALKKLQQMSMELEQMLQQLDQADESFGSEQYPELAEKFGEFMEDLRATTERQRELASQTKELRDRYREKMKERLAKKGDALRDELLKKVEDAARNYQQVNPDQLNYGAERSLEQVQSELENVRNALKVSDFDLAAEAAARAERAAEDLKMSARDRAIQDEMWGNPPEIREQSRQVAERMEQDAKTVREVNQQLQSLFPPAGSMMSQEDHKKLQELAEQQQQLQKRAESLEQQMEQMSQMAPIFDEQAMQQMEQVGQRMGQAAKEMEGRDPARGHGEQQAALEQLQEFERNMQQARNQQRGKGGLPLPMISGRRRGGGMGNLPEDVEIPDAEQYQAPKEFRKDILDAMKQGAPEKYKDQVKRYYEELVR